MASSSTVRASANSPTAASASAYEVSVNAADGRVLGRHRGAQSAKLPARASTAPTRSSGSRHQPSRQPVIPQNFEKEEMTTLSGSNRQAQSPTEPVKVTP